MNEVEKVMLNALEKVSREIVEREKKGYIPCPLIFHQPRRPDEVEGKKWR